MKDARIEACVMGPTAAYFRHDVIQGMTKLVFLLIDKLAGRETGPVTASAGAAAEPVRQNDRSRTIAGEQRLCALGNAKRTIIRKAGPVAAEIERNDSPAAVSNVQEQR